MLYLTDSIRISDREFFWTFSRSSGSGGQNVNKVNSKACLQWNVMFSPSIPDDLKQRILTLYAARVSSDGVITITSDRYRDRPKNIKDCLDKLRELLIKVLTPKKKRISTRPSKNQRKKRLEDKRHISTKKSFRKLNHFD